MQCTLSAATHRHQRNHPKLQRLPFFSSGLLYTRPNSTCSKPSECLPTPIAQALLQPPSAKSSPSTAESITQASSSETFDARALATFNIHLAQQDDLPTTEILARLQITFEPIPRKQSVYRLCHHYHISLVRLQLPATDPHVRWLNYNR